MRLTDDEKVILWLVLRQRPDEETLARAMQLRDRRAVWLSRHNAGFHYRLTQLVRTELEGYGLHLNGMPADKVILRGPLPGQVVTVAEAKHGLRAIAEKYSAGAAARYASDIGKARDAAQVLPRPVVVEDALVSASSSAAWDIVRSVSLARKWVTQKDPAVCQTCAGRDEKFDDGWELPAHPRCRCYWRPHASPDRHISPAFWRESRRWHVITNPMTP